MISLRSWIARRGLGLRIQDVLEIQAPLRILQLREVFRQAAWRQKPPSFGRLARIESRIGNEGQSHSPSFVFCNIAVNLLKHSPAARAAERRWNRSSKSKSATGGQLGGVFQRESMCVSCLLLQFSCNAIGQDRRKLVLILETMDCFYRHQNEPVGAEHSRTDRLLFHHIEAERNLCGIIGWKITLILWHKLYSKTPNMFLLYRVVGDVIPPAPAAVVFLWEDTWTHREASVAIYLAVRRKCRNLHGIRIGLAFGQLQFGKCCFGCNDYPGGVDFAFKACPGICFHLAQRPQASAEPHLGGRDNAKRVPASSKYGVRSRGNNPVNYAFSLN